MKAFNSNIRAVLSSVVTSIAVLGTVPVARAQSVVTQPGDPIVLVNGVNDGDSDAGPPPTQEGVEHAIDNVGQKYLNYLDLGSGLAVRPQVGFTIVTGLRLYTANDVEARDPASFLLEGSPSGLAGPWTQLASGPLALPAARNASGASVLLNENSQTVTFANSTAYAAYRLTFPTIKNAPAANSMQIGEIELLGTASAEAQGTVSFANDGATLVTNGLTMQPVVAGTSFKAQLYFLPDATATPSDDDFTVAGQVSPPVGLFAPGLFNGGIRTNSVDPPGSKAWYQVRVFEAAFGTTYQEAQSNPTTIGGRHALLGKSDRVKVDTGDPARIPPENPGSLVAAGLRGFILMTPNTVTSLNDNGPGSLREIIATPAYGDKIDFAVSGTITLTSGELIIGRNLNILGPGAKVLTVSGNHASRVFHITGAVSQISNLRIANGHASAGGGGIALESNGSLTVSNCAIEGCYAAGVAMPSQGGGAIAVVGTANLVIIGSTLSSNTTPYYGGGLYLFNGPNVSLVNSTISGNRTLDGSFDDAFGGGIFAHSSTLNITNSTIANNSSASAGGGIYKPPGTVALRNSLVASNSAPDGPDCTGSFFSAGYNLIGNSSGSTGFGATGDQLNLNAQIGSLADNGGPTLTHALLVGSPAIDKGGSGGPGSEQRGRTRPHDFSAVANAPGGDGSDIGAFELNPPVLSIARAANNVVLSWPDYDTGYTLEAKTDLNPSINWSNVPGTPAIVAGQFTVTNSATTGNEFYRLKSQ